MALIYSPFLKNENENEKNKIKKDKILMNVCFFLIHIHEIYNSQLYKIIFTYFALYINHVLVHHFKYNENDDDDDNIIMMGR